MSQRHTHARALFCGIAASYDLPAEILSFGQYARWRRALVRALPIGPDDLVLDVATGTGLIARALPGRVIGYDQSVDMLAFARRRGLTLAAGDANHLPFPDESFDTVVFSYLLRYVDDPPATLRELARVLKRGGTLANVEFGVPRHPVWRAGWRAHTLGTFPLAARAFGDGWAEVGRFLPRSILDWAREWPLDRQARAWQDAGIGDVRIKEMTFGTGVLMKGIKR